MLGVVRVLVVAVVAVVTVVVGVRCVEGPLVRHDVRAWVRHAVAGMRGVAGVGRALREPRFLLSSGSMISRSVVRGWGRICPSWVLVCVG